MKKIELYDLGMYSFPDGDISNIDRELILNRSVLKTLLAKKHDVQYHDMINSARAFVSNPTVTGLLQSNGTNGFPLLLVDGEVALMGRYPTVNEWAAFSGEEDLADELIPLTDEEVLEATGGSSCEDESSCSTCGGCGSAFR